MKPPISLPTLLATAVLLLWLTGLLWLAKPAGASPTADRITRLSELELRLMKVAPTPMDSREG